MFDGSSLQRALACRSDVFPPTPCPGDDRPFSADDAFLLQDIIMKPFSYKDMLYARRIYNYRLSRARRVVENAFGILTNKFPVFITKIALEPEKVTKLVLAACALHNTLITSGTADHKKPDTHNITPGSWREDKVLEQAALPVGTNVTVREKSQQEYLVKYVNSALAGCHDLNKSAKVNTELADNVYVSHCMVEQMLFQFHLMF